MMMPILSTAVFALFSLAVAAADIKTGMVPRIAFIAAFPVFVTLSLLRAEHYPLWAVFVGAGLGLFVFALAFFISGRKLGLADIWYSGLIGLVLGPLWWFPAIGIACLAGVIYIVVSHNRRIPFIPCMAAGGVAMSVIQGWFS